MCSLPPVLPSSCAPSCTSSAGTPLPPSTLTLHTRVKGVLPITRGNLKKTQIFWGKSKKSQTKRNMSQVYQEYIGREHRSWCLVELPQPHSHPVVREFSLHATATSILIGSLTAVCIVAQGGFHPCRNPNTEWHRRR